MKETTLIRTGRWSGRIRQPLRAYLAAKKNQNAYINELIARDAYTASIKPTTHLDTNKPPFKNDR